MANFIRKPVISQLEEGIEYHGTIIKASEYVSKTKYEYIQLMIELDDCVFRVSVFATVDSNNPIYSIVNELMGNSADDEFNVSMLIGLPVVFTTYTQEYKLGNYSSIDIIELDSEEHNDDSL